MSALGAAVVLDVRLQARNKLYAIGVVVAALLGLATRYFFPVELAGRVLSAFFLLFVGGTTFMFGASMLLMERSQGTLEALRASPMRSIDYIASKALTLTAFAAVESGIVFAIAIRGAPFSPVPLIAGVIALGAFYTFLGIGQVAPYDSVTSFLFPGALVTSLYLQLPFFYALGLPPDALWYAVPTQGPLLLMLGAFEPLAAWQWVVGVAWSVAGVGAAFLFARARLARHVGLPDG